MKLMPFHAITLLDKTDKIISDDGTIHLLICSMAIEAFLQDVKSFYWTINSSKPSISSSSGIKGPTKTQFSRGGASFNGEPPFTFISDNELRLMAFLESCEKESPVRKYELLINYLRLFKWTKGEDETFKDLQRMNKLRNLVVHLKSDALALNSDGVIESTPAVLDELIKNKVLSGKVKPQSSWINMLDQDTFIYWCRETAIKNMNNILNILPQDPITENFKNDYFQALSTF